MQRKHSLSPLQPAPRAPVAAFGGDVPDNVGLGGLQGNIASTRFPPEEEQDVAFSSVGGSGSGSADAIAATLAGYDHLCTTVDLPLVVKRRSQSRAAVHVDFLRCEEYDRSRVLGMLFGGPTVSKFKICLL